MAIAFPFVFAALWVLQRRHLLTSRQVRHIDLECKAHLYTAFTKTLASLAAVRAFTWQNDLISRHLKLLGTGQKTYYLMFCLQRWLNVVLDLFTAGLAMLLVAVALNLPGSTSKGAMGLPGHARPHRSKRIPDQDSHIMDELGGQPRGLFETWVVHGPNTPGDSRRRSLSAQPAGLAHRGGGGGNRI